MYTFFIMPFYVYAWLTDIFYGIGTISGKLASARQMRNPWQMNFVWGGLMGVLVLPLAAYPGIHLPTNWGAMWLATIVSFISGTLYLLTLYKLDVSVMSPLYSLRSVFGLVLGVFLFHEAIVFQQYFFISLIIIAGFFVSLDEHFTVRSFFRKPIALALFAILTSAFYSASIKNVMQYDNVWDVTFWVNVLGVIPLLLTIPLFKKDIQKTAIRDYQGAFISALFSVFGAITSNIAFGVNISISTAIIAVPMSMIFAFLFSFIKPSLLEKHTLKVYAIRFSAAAIMVIAALRLSG